MAGRRIYRKQDRRSCHYSSTPVLNQAQELGLSNQATTYTGSGILYSQVFTPQRENDIAQWVEETARFSVSSSYTDVSSTFSSENSRSSPSDELTLRLEETALLESIYNTYRTQNWIGRCMVNLYTSPRYGPWTLRFTGVPVLLLDLGGSRSRGRGVRFVLAERETGLTLWFDKLDNLSSYQDTDTVFHTFHASTDHTVRVGLSWDRPTDAVQFLDKVNYVLSRPENIGLSGPKQRTPKRRVSEGKVPKLSKSDISSPVGFTHNVSLTLDNLTDKLSLTRIENTGR